MCASACVLVDCFIISRFVCLFDCLCLFLLCDSDVVVSVVVGLCCLFV